jgi:hypothetical protein
MRRVKIVGGIPPFDSTKLYCIQVGAYINAASAEKAFYVLQKAGLNPSYENSMYYKRIARLKFKAYPSPIIFTVSGRI